MAKTMYAGKWRTEDDLTAAWNSYREYCDNKTVVKTAFSQKDGKFITASIPSPITCTIKGFCLFHKMTERNFYATYNKKKKFQQAIARMKEECEEDARQKLEQGSIEAKLAGLWMSKYGYSTNTSQVIDGVVPIVIKDNVDPNS